MEAAWLSSRCFAVGSGSSAGLREALQKEMKDGLTGGWLGLVGLKLCAEAEQDFFLYTLFIPSLNTKSSRMRRV